MAPDALGSQAIAGICSRSSDLRGIHYGCKYIRGSMTCLH